MSSLCDFNTATKEKWLSHREIITFLASCFHVIPEELGTGAEVPEREFPREVVRAVVVRAEKWFTEQLAGSALPLCLINSLVSFRSPCPPRCHSLLSALWWVLSLDVLMASWAYFYSHTFYPACRLVCLHQRITCSLMIRSTHFTIYFQQRLQCLPQA